MISVPTLKNIEDITALMQESPFHMEALRTVETLDLPELWVAAGFVRNYVWDRLHGYKNPTPLNDIDVIYYDTANQNEDFEKQQEFRLNALMPGPNWSVKNQARMHLKNNDPSYQSLEHALCHWCETVTPIGAKLGKDETISIIAPLGITDLIHMECHPTPFAKKNPEKMRHYKQRMRDKKWWELWPKVTVYDL